MALSERYAAFEQQRERDSALFRRRERMLDSLALLAVLTWRARVRGVFCVNVFCMYVFCMYVFCVGL